MFRGASGVSIGEVPAVQSRAAVTGRMTGVLMDYYTFLLGDPSPGWSDEESFEEILSEIEVADRGGFRGLFLAEHHNDRRKSLMSAPSVFLAAAAMRTSHLRLGTMVTVLGIHHPYLIAEEIATLDALSHGRAEWGFGAGGFGWRQVGIPYTDAKERLEEGVRFVQTFLSKGSSEDLEYEGRFWSGTAAGLVPAAVQKPYPPFWVSGHSRDTIAQAARLGMSFCTGFVSCETARHRRGVYHELWGEERPGEQPGRVAHMVLAAVGDSRRDIERVAMPAMKAKLYEFAQATLRKRDDPSFTFERALRERYEVETFDELLEAGIVVYGTVDDCIEQLEQIADTAADALLMQVRFGELDRSFSRESVERLALDVLPKVGGRLPASGSAGTGQGGVA